MAKSTDTTSECVPQEFQAGHELCLLPPSLVGCSRSDGFCEQDLRGRAQSTHQAEEPAELGAVIPWFRCFLEVPMTLAEGAGYGNRGGCLSFLSAVAEPAAAAAEFGHGVLWMDLHQALCSVRNVPAEAEAIVCLTALQQDFSSGTNEVVHLLNYLLGTFSLMQRCSGYINQGENCMMLGHCK